MTPADDPLGFFLLMVFILIGICTALHAIISAVRRSQWHQHNETLRRVHKVQGYAPEMFARREEEWKWRNR